MCFSRWSQSVLFSFMLLFSAFTHAEDNYQQWVQDIENRLDKTTALYASKAIKKEQYSKAILLL